MSNDNEGNGFHGMFFGVTEIPEHEKAYYAELISDSKEHDINNIMLVG